MLKQDTPSQAFPRKGRLLNAAMFRPLQRSKLTDLGGIQLENCFEDFLAYGINMVAAKETSGLYKAHCEKILVQLNVRTNEHAKSAAAYAIKDEEEDDRDEIGHSICTRGRELLGIGILVSGGADKVFVYFETHGLKCKEEKAADIKAKGAPPPTQQQKDRTMTLHNIRTHMRIVRRASHACVDPTDPKHMHSALYYWEQMESIFGRSATETRLTESLRAIDAFQAALPNNDDLRSAAEVVFVSTLRGVSLPWTTRDVASFARSRAAFLFAQLRFVLSSFVLNGCYFVCFVFCFRFRRSFVRAFRFLSDVHCFPCLSVALVIHSTCQVVCIGEQDSQDGACRIAHVLLQDPPAQRAN